MADELDDGRGVPADDDPDQDDEDDDLFESDEEGESEPGDDDYYASDDEDDPADIETIWITAEKPTAPELDITTTGVEMTADDILALGAENVADLAKLIPNLEIKVAGGTPTFFIRGVGLSDFNANAAGAVAIYQDDVPINAPPIQLGQFFDTDRVVVLKGPYGSGSMRNASAGAIRVTSRRPSGDLSSGMRATFGNLGLRDYEGFVDIPVLEDRLATRFAFRFAERGPIGTNGCAGAPPLGDERLPPVTLSPPPLRDGPTYCGEAGSSIRNPRFGDPDLGPQPFTVNVSEVPPGLPSKVNDKQRWSVRTQALLEVPEWDMSWLLNGHVSIRDELSELGQAIGTNAEYGFSTSTGYREPDTIEMAAAILDQVNAQYPDLGPVEQANLRNELLAEELAHNLDIRPRRGDYNRVGKNELKTWGGFLRGDMLIGDVSLMTLTGYEYFERSREADQDFTPDRIFELISDDEAWQVSSELKLTGELSNHPIHWEAGGYFLIERLHSDDTSFVEEDVNTLTRVYDQDTDSFAFYAGASWDFLDDFTLEGGIRYNWVRKTFDFAIDRPLFLVSLRRETLSESTWDEPTGSVALVYRFSAETSVFWKYNHGFKPGHYNASAQILRSLEAVEPEEVDAIEAGFKTSLFDRRLDLSGSFFYYKYKNYQVFLVADEFNAPPTFQVVNAEKTESYGADVDLILQPLMEWEWVPDLLELLRIQAHFGWLESRFIDFDNEIFLATPDYDFIPPRTSIVPITTDYSGNRLPNSPRFKLGLSIDWPLDFGRWGTLVPRYDMAWTDDIAFDATGGRGTPDADGNIRLPEFAAGQPAFALHNVRLAYRSSDGTFEIAGWVRNIEDKVYKPFAFDASTFANIVVNFVGDPRTFGVDLSINF